MTGVKRRRWRLPLRHGAPGPLLAAAFSMALLLAPQAAHADFADGVRAYEAGDHQGAYRAWLPLAEGGDVAAMRNIGHLYRWGQGVEKDIGQAIHWYRLAAEKGFSRAQANLAAIYLQGDEGVPVNYEEAHKWFAAAAVQNLAVAQYNLGLMYELGLGVEKSEPRALGWYNLAAKAGQPEAIERLSQLVKTTEPPLVSGVKVPAVAPAGMPQAATADSKTETTTIPSSAMTAPAAQPAPAPNPAAASAPAVAADPVPAPAAAPAAAEQTVPPPVSAAAPPAEPRTEAGDRPGLLGRFYSAISSGGGVSIPDMFKGAPEGEAPAEPAGDGKPGESGAGAPDGRP
jgi:TPR repeat protein